MHFLPSSVLTTGTFCHFLTKCLPAVPSSGGIPSRPAFVPGGQFSADCSFFYKERISAGPLFPAVVLFYVSDGWLSFNSERKSPKNASRNHRFLLAAFFHTFCQQPEKWAVGDTFLAQSTIVAKKYSASAESVQVIMEDAAFACAARCGRTDFCYIVFYRRTKSCFNQTVAPCSCGVSWLLRRAWDSSSPMLLSPFRLFCIIELRMVFQHFAG